MNGRVGTEHSQDAPSGPEQIVLVIEDDDNIRLLEVLNLRLAGWTVIEAEDGLTGLWLAASGCPT